MTLSLKTRHASGRTRAQVLRAFSTFKIIIKRGFPLKHHQQRLVMCFLQKVGICKKFCSQLSVILDVLLLGFHLGNCIVTI